MSLAFYDIAAGHFLRGRPLAPPTSYVSAGGEEERRAESKRVKCDTLVSGSLQICLIELQRESSLVVEQPLLFFDLRCDRTESLIVFVKKLFFQCCFHAPAVCRTFVQ